MRILVVEDEPEMNATIVQKLELENYVVDTCRDGRSALEYLTLAEYDGVLLDAMLPGMSGFDLLKKINKFP